MLARKNVAILFVGCVLPTWRKLKASSIAHCVESTLAVFYTPLGWCTASALRLGPTATVTRDVGVEKGTTILSICFFCLIETGMATIANVYFKSVRGLIQWSLRSLETLRPEVAPSLRSGHHSLGPSGL